jgi:hypothetical protein
MHELGRGTLSLKALHHFPQSRDEPFDFYRDIEAKNTFSAS